MRYLTTNILAICLLVPAMFGKNSTDSLEDIEDAFPALVAFNDGLLLEEVWNRPELSARDRSIVTLAVLVSRNQLSELDFYIRKALDSEVNATEISELITHLAFYTGWGNGTSAAKVASKTFSDYGVAKRDLPQTEPELLPLDEEGEARRQKAVDSMVGSIAPGLAHFTTVALFQDLWLRPDLAPRDRSLVTVSALIATGQFDQVQFHLSKAMDNGLTKDEAAELITHIAFYAGWPNAFSSVPVFRKVLESREG